jgi:hypothetical protein
MRAMAKKKPRPMAKNPHAVALGRKGGKKGGKARWAGVSAEQRAEILRRASLTRWRRRGTS